MEQSYFEQYNSQVVELFNEIRTFLQESKNDVLSAKAELIPFTPYDKDKKITIVFAGQYSAGKSSLLSILTGEKLDVGGGITTTSCQSLEWEGVTVIDTPGIHTQNRPDHDKITYEQLAKADLIVFVITSDGFSNHLAQHFRKLINEKGKGHEMMLVINKMDQTSLGNASEQRAELLEKDVLPVIDPYTAEDMYTTFVSTEYYNNAFLPEYEKYKVKLIENSGIQDFIANLNRFISDKHLLGSYTTSLYEVEKILSDLIDSMTTGDSLVDGSIHILNERRQCYEDAKFRIKEQTNTIIRQNTANVKKWGNEISSQVTSNSKEDDINELLAEKQQAVANLSDQIGSEIEGTINRELEKWKKTDEQLMRSNYVDIFSTEFCRMAQIKGLSDKTINNITNAASLMRGLANKIVSSSLGAKMGSSFADMFKTSGYANSNLSKIVYKGSKILFNKRFKPWEAVRWTKNISMGARLLSGVGGFLCLAMQMYSDKQEDKRERQLSQARTEIRSCFGDVAQAIELHYDKATDTWVQENINPNIAQIDQDIQAINHSIEIANEQYNKLSDLLGRVRKLIDDIQNV